MTTDQDDLVAKRHEDHISIINGWSHVSFDNEGAIGIVIASYTIYRNVSYGQQR